MLKSLTSFRFIAAFMVFLWHNQKLQIYQLGYVGVSFFFVLSGFILTYTYNLKFIYLRKKNIANFYVARFAKIYPVHILTFTLSIPITVSFSNDFILIIKQAIVGIINILLMQSYIPRTDITFGFNGVAWSISTEFFFYLMFPFLIWGFSKINRGNFRICLSLIVFFIFDLILTLIYSSNKTISLDEWFLYTFPLTRILDFIIGINLGFLFVINKKFRMTSSLRTIFTLLEISALLLLCLSIIFSVNINQGLRFSVYYLPIWCILIYSFAFQAGYISRILSNSILVYLGEISFSFYMIHQLILRYYVKLDKGLNFSVCLIISLVLCAMVYHFYEEPIRKKIRFGWKKPIKNIPNKEASA